MEYEEIQKLMSAADGTVKVNDTTSFTTPSLGYRIDEVTVIATLEVDGVASNVIADYVTTPATGFAGTELLVAHGESHFTNIVLTSGSVTAILK